MYQTIKYEVKNSIGYVTINRPETLNALNKTVLEELFDVFNQIDADENVRVVILTGEGRSLRRMRAGHGLRFPYRFFQGQIRPA